MTDFRYLINASTASDGALSNNSASDRSPEYSIAPMVPPPLQLRYPPGSLLPYNTSSTNDSFPLDESSFILMDNSALSTVAEEEQDTFGSTSGQSTPPQSILTVQTRIQTDSTGQSDQTTRSSDVTTPTLSSSLSNSLQRLSHIE